MTEAPSSDLAEVGQRLAQAVRAVGGNAVVSQKVGISTRSLSRYIAGEAEMPISTALRLSQAVGRSLDWLLMGIASDESVLLSPDMAADAVSIPLLSVLAGAGAGVAQEQVDVVRRLPFSGPLLRQLGVSPHHAHFITARGDSMEPTISDGAIVLVDASIHRIRNDGIYVIVVDGDVRLKRVQKGVGVVTLISDNPKYRPELLSSSDDLRVEGKVFWTGSGL